MRPSVIRNCHKPHIVGFVAEYGAYDQHSSMIARTKELPGIIVPGALKSLKDGDFVTIDGSAGTVTILPRQ
jgi:phosphoenolpyruvate-protein kinase (PTS system EI component)